jgi:hypothetical protein
MTENSQEKTKRLVVSVTVGAVLLFVFLVGIMIYQLIAIGVSKKEQADLDAKIAKYEQLITKNEQILDARSSDWYAKRRANELGYYYGDDIFLGD